MANRDVQLIIRAKDEASRALASVATELDALVGKQRTTATASGALGSSIAQLVTQMASFERVSGLVGQAADRAEAAIARQRTTYAETANQLAAVTAQLANARRAIESSQSAVVDARLSGGDGGAQVAQLQAAIAAARELESQQQRLTTTLANQKTVLGQQEGAFRELASMANSADAAVAAYGDEQERAALKTRAATAAETEYATALAATERMARAKARFNGPDVADAGQGAPRASDTALADLLRQEQAAGDAAEREAKSFQALLDRLEPVAVIKRQLAKETEQLRKALQAGTITTEQFTKAEQELVRQSKAAEEAIERIGKGEAGKPSLFGLKPYELTNLGYQVNDVITQLASGTPILQVMAQQGGQILQLLPNIGSKIVAAFGNPYFLGAAAIAGAIAVALKRSSDNANRLDKIEGMLTGIGREAGVSAKQLDAMADSMRSIGISTDDALAAMQLFLSRGLNVSQMEAFAKAAKDTATVTGGDLKESMEQVADAFTHGYEGVAELDDKLQFLSVSERELIRTMFESGQAVEARTMAFKLFQSRMQEIADKSRGEWSTALDNLGKSLDRLLDRFANSAPIRGFIDLLDEAAKKLDYLLSRYQDLNLQQIDERLAQIDKAKRDNPEAFAPGVKRFTLFGEDNILEEEAALRKRREELVRNKKAQGDLYDQQSAAARKREADQLNEIERERNLENAKTAAVRIALRGEQAYQAALKETGSVRVAEARKAQAIEKARAEEAKKAAAEQKKLADTIKLQSPIAGALNVSSGFSLARRNPVTGKVQPHQGIDIPVPVGTSVRAPASGIVAEKGQDSSRGKFIVLDHGKGTKTQFYHLSDNDLVKAGELVNAGDLIGKSGNTGRSTGPHLHFGVTQNDRPVDPRKALAGERLPGSLADVAAQQTKAEEKRLADQENYNREIDQEIERRKQAAEQLQREAVLSGEALIDAQREAAVREALTRAEQQAADKQIALDDKRRAALADAVRAEFDLQHARERATAAIDENSAERDALLARVELAQRAGDTEGVRAAEQAVAALDKKLLDAIDRAIKFWEAMGDNPTSRAAIQNLKNTGEEIRRSATDRERARVETPVNQLGQQQQGLQEQIRFYRDAGQTAVVKQLEDQLRAVNEQYLTAIDSALMFWQAQNGPDAQAAILNLENLRNQVIASQNEFTITAGQIQDAFAGSLSDSFRGFAQSIAEGRNVFAAFGEAALSFAASFLQKLAEMGLQLLAFKLAMKIGFGGLANGFSSALGAAPLQAAGTTLAAAAGGLSAGAAALTGAGGLWTGVAASISAAAAALAAAAAASSVAVLHEGGIAGGVTRRRALSPFAFAGAIRYHSGGIAGLRPNEVPAILQKGEEVITRGDPRHRNNTGGGGSGGNSLSQILAIGDREIASAMKGAAGEEVWVTHLRRNRETVRQMLNGKQ